MTLSMPNHLHTLDEWAELRGRTELKIELVEGVVQMTPAPLSWHQKSMGRIMVLLDEQLPQELTSLQEAEVVLGEQPPTVRIPDTVITHTRLYETNPARYAAADVLLVGEVLSTGTRRVDRVMKFSEYAEAGIPQYWIVDLDAPATLLAYTLVEGTYELSKEHSGTAHLDVAGHPVVLDLEALTRR